MFIENLIRGLDDDEVDFLEVVDKAKSVAEQRQQQEEKNELRDFREQVASIQEQSMDSVSFNTTFDGFKPIDLDWLLFN